MSPTKPTFERLAALLALSGALGVATLGMDSLLHAAGLAWVGRYLGIPGTILIVASLSYSLRKRHLISIGSSRQFLAFHQFAGWLGSWLVLVHAGIHFNAPLPWLATLAMGINVVSGMVGKFFVIAGARVDPAEAPLDFAASALVRRWRVIHLPIFFTFAALAIAHIVSVLAFWNWPFADGR